MPSCSRCTPGTWRECLQVSTGWRWEWNTEAQVGQRGEVAISKFHEYGHPAVTLKRAGLRRLGGGERRGGTSELNTGPSSKRESPGHAGQYGSTVPAAVRRARAAFWTRTIARDPPDNVGLSDEVQHVARCRNPDGCGRSAEGGQLKGQLDCTGPVSVSKRTPQEEEMSQMVSYPNCLR